MSGRAKIWQVDLEAVGPLMAYMWRRDMNPLTIVLDSGSQVDIEVDECDEACAVAFIIGYAAGGWLKR